MQYKGRWVTPEEKGNLEAGRILYKGQWILPEEKPFVDKGLVRYKQRWVTAEEKTNLDQGLARFEGKWLKREEVDARRQQWANAWEVSNKHFLVRTNTSEDGAYALLALLDATMVESKRLMHAEKSEPSKPMTVYLFREPREYEDWCHQKNADSYVTQPDMYDTKENVLALCQRNLTPEVFQPWVASASFSQFVWTCFDKKFPEWFEYGLRGYFQAGRYENGKLTLGVAYKAILPPLQSAISTGKQIKLRELVSAPSSVFASADRMPLYQAETWALVHFILNGKSEKWRKSFGKLVDEYLKADFPDTATLDSIDEMGFKIFEKVFGKDIDALETEWIAASRLLN
ncbi:MAG: hypothetical protein HYR85_07155 [Planctomycetes bacterium]|nr:hypothetical protein [Planctomycetota bacterium]MBI3848538.1 hypothetical protein [Planctomycetota bacterium]